MLSHSIAPSDPVPEAPAESAANELAEALKEAISMRARPDAVPDGRWVIRRGISPLETKDIR
jgi:hypothetical protein